MTANEARNVKQRGILITTSQSPAMTIMSATD